MVSQVSVILQALTMKMDCLADLLFVVVYLCFVCLFVLSCHCLQLIVFMFLFLLLELPKLTSCQ